MADTGQRILWFDSTYGIGASLFNLFQGISPGIWMYIHTDVEMDSRITTKIF